MLAALLIAAVSAKAQEQVPVYTTYLKDDTTRVKVAYVDSADKYKVVNCNMVRKLYSIDGSQEIIVKESNFFDDNWAKMNDAVKRYIIQIWPIETQKN